MSKRVKSRLSIALLLMISLTTSCASEPPPVSPACGWLKKFKPDAGFETRYTHDEKVQLVELNDKIAAFCPAQKLAQ